MLSLEDKDTIKSLLAVEARTLARRASRSFTRRFHSPTELPMAIELLTQNLEEAKKTLDIATRI